VSCRLSASARATILAHARCARPAECCGVLVGRPAAIVEAVPTRNLATRPDRFLIDPRDHIDARRLARRRSLDVVGFYHSHPHSAALPSETDVAEFAYPGALYLIVGLLERQPPDIRLYRFDEARFAEVALADG
jgi:proteasome lid subunit RPN8/RPN11